MSAAYRSRKIIEPNVLMSGIDFAQYLLTGVSGLCVYPPIVECTGSVDADQKNIETREKARSMIGVNCMFMFSLRVSGMRSIHFARHTLIP